MAFNAGEVIAYIKATAEGVKAGVQEAKDHLQGMADGMKAAGEGLAQTGAAMTMAVTGPIVAGAAGFYKLSQAAMGFEQQMNEVFTLLPGISDVAMKEMSSQAKEFAKEFGTLPDEVVPALYQSISAGVPPGNVFDFMEVAQKAAIGGVTDLTTAVDGITSVVNAYGEEVVDASKASDLMFTAVKLGKTTFGELSSSLFNVIPTAAGAGVAFGDVAAALAALTAQGVPTNVATTQIRAIISDLSKEGTKTSKVFQDIAGIGFKEFIAQGGNLQEALQLLEQYAKDAGLGVNDLFGQVESGNAALALTGQGTEKFSEALAEMATAAGATETAFDTMEQGAGRQLEKLKAQWEVLKIELGDKFLPIVTGTLIPVFQESVLPILVKVADVVGKVAEFFGNLPQPVQTVILTVIGLVAALGPVLLIVGKIMVVISTLMPLFAALGPVLAALTGPVGIVIAIIVALIAVIILVWKNWDKITEWIKNAWGNVVDFFKNKWEEAKQFYSGIWEGIKNLFSSALEFIKNLFFKYHPLGLIISHWDEIKAFFSATWDWIKGIFSDGLQSIINYFMEKTPLGFIITHWDQIKAFFAATWERIKEIFKAGLDTVVGFFQELPGRIWTWLVDTVNKVETWRQDAIEKLKDAGQKAVEGFMDFIKDLPTKVWNVLVETAKKLLEIGGTLWNNAKKIAGDLWGGFKAGLGISSPSYLEKAMDAIAERSRKLPEEMKKSFQALNSLDSTMPDFAMAGAGAGRGAGGSGLTSVMIELAPHYHGISEAEAKNVNDDLVEKLIARLRREVR